MGEEVANQWTAFVFKQLAKTTASWIAEVAPELNLESQAVAIEGTRELEANLREITKIAANAFDLGFEDGELALPRLRGETFAHPALELKEPKNDLGVELRFLPVRWSARRFKPAVETMTNQLVKIHRAHALALITDGARASWTAGHPKWMRSPHKLNHVQDQRLPETKAAPKLGGKRVRRWQTQVGELRNSYRFAPG